MKTKVSISPAETKIRDDLKSVSLSVTQVRIRLLAMLRNSSTPISAERLKHLLDAAGISIGRASLFRNLDSFVKVGLAERINSNARSSQYTACHITTEHHHHLICKKCNRIIEVDGCLTVETIQEIEVQSNVVVTGHSIIFYGLCHRCR